MDSGLTSVECPIHRYAMSDPSAVAIYTKDNVLTYQQLNDYIHSYTHFLIDQNKVWTPNHPITIVMKDPVATIIIYFSFLRMGISSLILSDKTPQSLIETLMTQAGSNYLVDQYAFPEITDLQYHLSSLNVHQWAHIVPTSGSMGISKLVVLSIGNYLSHLNASQDMLPVSSSSIWHLVLPLSHVSGMSILYRSFFNGGAISLEGSEITPTHISLVETQCMRYLDQNPSFLSKISYILLGGSAISDRLLERCNEFISLIYTTYGMSEASSQIATRGDVLPQHHIKINNGRVFIKGPSLFQGYLKNGCAVLALDPDGFFDTGDCGDIVDGKLVIKGRYGRMFISGGENIYPEEIENALLKLPEIEKAVVISVPDDVFQRKPIAFIFPYYEDTDFILKKLFNTLPSYKVPKEYMSYPLVQDNKLKLDLKELEKIYLHHCK